MSLQNCQSGATTGFPLKLSQNLYSTWPGTNTSKNLQSLITPTDFTVQWAPASPLSGIAVQHDASKFHITGLDLITNQTTLTYGDATYNCSPILSIVKNQHMSLSSSAEEIYEMILAFQINNKSLNPSSPDIILLCRSLIPTTGITIPLWAAVNESVKTNKPKGISSFDMSTIGIIQSI